MNLTDQLKELAGNVVGQLKGQGVELTQDLARDLRETFRFIRKRRRYKARSRVTSYEFRTVKVVRIRRRVWEIHHHPQGCRDAVLVERVKAHYSEVMTWAAEQERTYIYLWKLQNALSKGKLTPKQYYRALDRWGGCKREHIHSQYCRYHSKH